MSDSNKSPEPEEAGSNDNVISYEQIEKLFGNVFSNVDSDTMADDIYKSDVNFEDLQNILADFSKDNNSSKNSTKPSTNLLYDSDSDSLPMPIPPKKFSNNLSSNLNSDSLAFNSDGGFDSDFPPQYSKNIRNQDLSSSPKLDIDTEFLKDIFHTSTSQKYSPKINSYTSPNDSESFDSVKNLSEDFSESNDSSDNSNITDNPSDSDNILSQISHSSTLRIPTPENISPSSRPTRTLRKSTIMQKKSPSVTPTKKTISSIIPNKKITSSTDKSPQKIRTIKPNPNNNYNLNPSDTSSSINSSSNSDSSDVPAYLDNLDSSDSDFQASDYSDYELHNDHSPPNRKSSQKSKITSPSNQNKKTTNSSLLERLYDYSDYSADSDTDSNSDVDAIQDNFMANLRNFGISKIKGVKKNPLSKMKKTQKDNLEFFFDSDEKSGESSGQDSSSDERNIEQDAWKSVEEIVNFKQDDLDIINNKKSKRKKKTLTKKIDPEIQNLLGQANLFYVNKEPQKSIILLKEVIRMDPGVSQAWHTLALIQEEAGDSDRALKLYLMSAHLAPSDPVLWKRIASLFSEKMDSYRIELEKLVGSKADSLISGVEVVASADALEAAKKYDIARDQTLYCLGKACIADKKDIKVWLQRLSLFEQLQNNQMIGVCYSGILKIQPLNINLIRKALPLFVHTLNDTNQPIKWLSILIKYYWFINRRKKSKPLSAKKFSYSDLNMLIELRIVREEYEEAISDLKRGSRLIQGRANEIYWEPLELADNKDLEFAQDSNTLPIELIVKLGQCRVMTGNLDAAKKHFESLFELPVDGYADLYQDVANTYYQKKMFHESLAVYKKVVKCDEYNNCVVWAQMALLYKEINNFHCAIIYAKYAVEEDENEVPMRVFLCEMYEKVGDIDSAIKMFSEVEEIREKAINDELKIPAPGLFMKNDNEDNSNWDVDRLKYVPMPFFRRNKLVKNKHVNHKVIETSKNTDENSDNDHNYSFESNQSFMINTQESFLRVKTYKYTPLAIARIKAAEVIEFCKAGRILFNDWHKNVYGTSDRVEEEGAGTGGSVSKKTANTFRGIKFDIWKDVFIKVCDSFNRAIQQERQVNGGFAEMVYWN
ncbi:General transcription factor 3C polypeptide 3 [Smittium culicis]|uniref:General transcription factor 3C polypeptide 3 n=1 Tax=Smittium culicis TaxID=133412 RepID=A0A1R1Y4R4_9FUNG|nr:General transcription factor 3C polypeptide 3 [Smittium culicis]